MDVGEEEFLHKTNHANFGAINDKLVGTRSFFLIWKTVNGPVDHRGKSE